MKHKIMWLMIAVCTTLLLAAACAPAGDGGMEAQPGGDGYKTISAEEAHQILADNPQAVLVDVRTQEEYDEAHIEGAILIPTETIGEEPPTELPDLDAEILIYCRTGIRAGQAAEKLSKMGYTNVSNMGGINDWPYETVTGEN